VTSHGDERQSIRKSNGGAQATSAAASAKKKISKSVERKHQKKISGVIKESSVMKIGISAAKMKAHRGESNDNKKRRMAKKKMAKIAKSMKKKSKISGVSGRKTVVSKSRTKNIIEKEK